MTAQIIPCDKDSAHCGRLVGMRKRHDRHERHADQHQGQRQLSLGLSEALECQEQDQADQAEQNVGRLVQPHGQREEKPGGNRHDEDERHADLKGRRDGQLGEQDPGQHRGKRRRLPTHLFADR